MKCVIPLSSLSKLRFYALFLLLFTRSLSLHAQSTQGAILGTVRDSSGAIVPNATVTATNIDTSVSRTDTTDASGNYQLLNLSAGRYKVEITASGFDTTVIDNLLLVARA